MISEKNIGLGKDEWSSAVHVQSEFTVDTATTVPDQENEYTALNENADGKPCNGDPANNGNVDGSVPDTDVGIPVRYIFSLLGFLAFFTMYCLRTSLNVAMVAMVNSTALAEDSDHNGTSQTSDCPDASASNSSNATSDFLGGEFLWDEKTQGVILGAFFYGYLLPQMLGGWLADKKVEGKRLLGFSLLLSSLLTLAIPAAARAGWVYLTALRALQGLVESVIYPAMHTLCSKWVPAQERKLVSFCYSGGEMGVVFGMLLTGLLCRYGFAGGWPSAFYFFGTLGCVWFILWVLLVYESPAHHPRISDKERRYIESSVGRRPRGTVSVPWRKILRSSPVWAVCIAHFSYNWGFNSMFTRLPAFLREILHFGIVTNGFLSALPYFLLCLTQVLGGFGSDFLRQHFSTGFVRKLMFTIGSAIPASFMLATGYVECDDTLAVVLLTIGLAGKGIAASSILVNHLDFAPGFAGTLFGMSNTVATVPGCVAPFLIGILTDHDQTIGQWRKFFYVTAAIYVVSILSFLWLGKGDVQSWAAPPPTSTTIPSPLLQKEKSKEEDKVQLH